jgi:hypothetical protein
MKTKFQIPFIKDMKNQNIKEALWFSITFLLFIISGPFSVFAVIPTLFTIPQDEKAMELKPVLSHKI